MTKANEQTDEQAADTSGEQADPLGTTQPVGAEDGQEWEPVAEPEPESADE